MSDVAVVYAGVIGAAVGALGSQVAGVIQTISKSRARGAKASAAAAAAAEARRRPLYEALIGATNKARVLFMQLRLTLEAGPPDRMVLAQYGANFEAVMNQIYTCVTAVRIDGSTRARDISSELLQKLMAYAEDLPAAERLGAEQISTMIGTLKRAEDDLIQAARDDFGGGPAAARSLRLVAATSVARSPVLRLRHGGNTCRWQPASAAVRLAECLSRALTNPELRSR